MNIKSLGRGLGRARADRDISNIQQAPSHPQATKSERQMTSRGNGTMRLNLFHGRLSFDKEGKSVGSKMEFMISNKLRWGVVKHSDVKLAKHINIYKVGLQRGRVSHCHSSSSSLTLSPASMAFCLLFATFSFFLVSSFLRFFATLKTPPVPDPQAAQLGSFLYRFSAQLSQK